MKSQDIGPMGKFIPNERRVPVAERLDIFRSDNHSDWLSGDSHFPRVGTILFEVLFPDGPTR